MTVKMPSFRNSKTRVEYMVTIEFPDGRVKKSSQGSPTRLNPWDERHGGKITKAEPIEVEYVDVCL